MTTYISVDIEATGPAPPEYSMLSLGACIVGERDKTFYMEFKPQSNTYDREAMQIGCLHLECIDRMKQDDPHYDATSEQFCPEIVLQELLRMGATPGEGMQEFVDWTNTMRGNDLAVLVTDVQPFDGMYVMSYLAQHRIEHPFGHKGLALGTLYKGITGRMDANLRELGIEDDRIYPHHALDDAIFQAKLAEAVFHRMKQV